MPTLNGNEGSYITQANAKTLGDNYVNSRRYEDSGECKAHYFGKDKLNAVLSQSGCVGLRIYYGTKIESPTVEKPELIIVGVDSDGNDLLDEDLIVDVSLPCPTLCPESGKGLMD